jgi:RNA polymerase-binding transcription factor DksA
LDLETIRKRLLSRREELARRASDAGADLRREHEPLSPDFSEQAVQRENDDVLRGLGDAARDELASINRALVRIEAGNYLTCSVCGADIDERRLDAVPYADRCAACAR